MGFLSRKNKTVPPPEPPVDEQHPIIEELREMEDAVPERGARNDEGHTSQPAGPVDAGDDEPSRPAGPVDAGDPPSPATAQETVPPTTPPAGETESADAGAPAAEQAAPAEAAAQPAEEQVPAAEGESTEEKAESGEEAK